jgi:hypothetical protein
LAGSTGKFIGFTFFSRIDHAVTTSRRSTGQTAGIGKRIRIKAALIAPFTAIDYSIPTSSESTMGATGVGNAIGVTRAFIANLTIV